MRRPKKLNTQCIGYNCFFIKFSKNLFVKFNKALIELNCVCSQLEGVKRERADLLYKQLFLDLPFRVVLDSRRKSDARKPLIIIAHISAETGKCRI